MTPTFLEYLCWFITGEYPDSYLDRVLGRRVYYNATDWLMVDIVGGMLTCKRLDRYGQEFGPDAYISSANVTVMA